MLSPPRTSSSSVEPPAPTAPPNARRPDYALRADEAAREAEEAAAAVRAAMREQLERLQAAEAERAGVAMRRWPEVSRLVSITRAFVDAADHVPELAALHAAAATALEPFETAQRKVAE